MAQSKQNYPSHKGELAAAIMGMRKFEHILRFKPFILRTDSKCMQFLDSLKEVRGIYARWLNFLQGFEFEVVHRPGVTNQNADALSRMDNLPTHDGDAGAEEEADMREDIYHLDHEAVEAWARNPLPEQEKDEVLRDVIGWIRNGKKPSKEEAREFDADRQVYRGVFEKLQIEAGRGLVFGGIDGGANRICLPAKYFQKVFRMLHCHPSAGHFRIGATQKKFKQKFFMPGSSNRIAMEIGNNIGGESVLLGCI